MKKSDVSILAIGDICLKKERKQKLIDSELQKLFANHDLVTCDLGITLSDACAPKALKIGPYEQQTPDSVNVCKEIGIDIVRLAGNHIMDFGIQGMGHLKKKLSENNIEYIGVSDAKEDNPYKPYVCEINGIKIACFSVGEMCFGYLDDEEECGYAWVNSYRLEEEIKNVRENVDWILVFAHAGLETVPIPLAEWRHRYYTLIDIGADFVIATHSHIVQGIEEHGKGLIAYSLGNFAYDLDSAKDKKAWDTSIAISLKLMENKKYFYETIPLKYEKDIVRINTGDDFFQKKFQYAIETLRNRQFYLEEIKRECLEYFEHYYYDYYVMNAVNMTGKIDYAFLWHNVAIESQLYMTRKALRELMYIDLDERDKSVNPYGKKYIMWGYGKVGKVVKEYFDRKNIRIIGIVDERIRAEEAISKEQLISMLKKDEEITVIISTIVYYCQIRDYLFEKLHRRRYIDFRHFMVQIESYELERKIKDSDSESNRLGTAVIKNLEGI